MLFKSQQIVILLGTWVLLSLALLMLFNVLEAAYFFSIAFLGFLLIAALLSPYVVKPAWKTRMYYVTIVATLVFGLIIAQQALAIIQEGFS